MKSTQLKSLIFLVLFLIGIAASVGTFVEFGFKFAFLVGSTISFLVTIYSIMYKEELGDNLANSRHRVMLAILAALLLSSSVTQSVLTIIEDNRAAEQSRLAKAEFEEIIYANCISINRPFLMLLEQEAPGVSESEWHFSSLFLHNQAFMDFLNTYSYSQLNSKPKNSTRNVSYFRAIPNAELHDEYIGAWRDVFKLYSGGAISKIRELVAVYGPDKIEPKLRQLIYQLLACNVIDTIVNVPYLADRVQISDLRVFPSSPFIEYIEIQEQIREYAGGYDTLFFAE